MGETMNRRRAPYFSLPGIQDAFTEKNEAIMTRKIFFLLFLCGFIPPISGLAAEPDPEAQELADRANEAMAAEEWDEADRLLDEALRIVDDAPELWIGSGFARVRLGRAEEARESYETALALYRERVDEDPENVGFVMNVGYTLVLLDRREEAVAYLESAAERHPEERAFGRFIDIIDGLEENFAEFIVPDPDNGEN